MAEPLIQDRVAFGKKGTQKKFLLKISKSLNLTWKQLANVIGVHDRTVRDWVNEKYRMPYLVAQTLSKKACIPLPKNVRIINWKQELMKASKKGGEIKYEIYGNVGGDEIKRKKAWKKWWDKKGIFIEQQILQKKCIKIPQKSVKLAEFVGIMMGDGGMTKYATTITLNSESDLDYSIFVCKLIEKLFNVSPKIYKDRDSLAMGIVVHRKNLVEFCESIGLKVGNKPEQGLNIPSWIKNNKRYSVACVRGLVDTDGSIFTHKYKVRGKEYNYKKLSFTSCSTPLCQSVYKILKNNGITSRLARNIDVRIDSKESMKTYFKLFNTHNPKHLKRYIK